ncbi:MAG: M23 family metallopeptidase [Rickettsiales bacterium]|jgi:murein DD-endopeptidase MepM/ murein hydrolase activator NlpD|nr:M23 family metallopeptidase [Rickettsiales bacterium]
MKKVVLKKDPYRKNLAEYIESAFHAVFRERSFIVSKAGRFSYWRISPALQFFAFSMAAALFWWTGFTSRIYFRSSGIMQEKDAQISEARDKFNAVLSDVRAYRDTIGEIHGKIEASHNKTVNLLYKNDSLTKIERDNLIKEKLLLSAELKYVNASLDEFARGVDWASVESAAGGYKTTKNELEKNVALNENVFLKKRNSQLEKSVNDMSELQSNLIDKVVVLANGNISDIEKTLSKIDIILSQLNLKDRNVLVRKLEGEREEGLGGKYIPLKNIDLADSELNQKFKNANLKVNLWEGLSKVRGMLPLGAPVRTDIRITSPFGVRIDPFMKTPAMHTGIDFAGKLGTPLYTTSKGKVVQSGNRGEYGLSVEVYHGLGFSTLYAHLSKVSAKVGDIIEEGTKIGLAGSTGRSTATHLHYELRHNGRALNPYAFVKADNN